MKLKQGFSKVVVRYHTEEEPNVVHEVEREIPGGNPEARTMFMNDNERMAAMTHAEASALATSMARNLEKRIEEWDKQAAKGRTPGASSRPKERAKQTTP